MPLDFPSFESARPFIQLLKDHVGLFKIGLTLFVREGLQGVKKVEAIAGGRKIFLDLKLYDTPWQVRGAAAALVSEPSDIRFVTVHTSGGDRVMQAAVKGMQEKTEVLGVTVLTTQGRSEGLEAGTQAALEDRVLALARMAKGAGASGVVASGHEAAGIRKALGQDFLIVTPGIRPAWSQVPQDDQRRTMTPGEAIFKGADFLVVGRPIVGDKDPVGAAQKIAEEIEKAAGLVSL